MHRGGAGNVSPRLFALLTVNRVRLYRKYHGAVATACFWAAVLVHVGLRSLASSAPRPGGLPRPLPHAVADDGNGAGFAV